MKGYPRHFGSALFCCWLVLGSVDLVRAEDKAPPIEVIVPFGPGGGADQLARMAAPRLEAILETPVVVANVPGTTGVTGISKLLTSEAGGHTMAVLTGDTFSLLALTPPPWQLNDVIPLAVLIRQPSGLFVAADGRFKSWDEFEQAAKSKPYELKVAITGEGSPDDITVHYLASKGVRLSPVTFDYPERRYQAVLDGQVDALYEQPGDVRALLEDGRLRPILFFSASVPSEFKDVPIAVDRGYDVTIQQFRALVIKAGTDPQQVERLTDAIDEVATAPEYQAFLQGQYALPDSYLPAQEAFAFMEKELNETKKMTDSLLYMPAQFKNQAEAPEPCNWGATDPCLEIDMREEQK